MVKRVGKYEIGRTLGEGTFGKVKYAVNTETGERVAIKILDKEKIQRQNMGAQIKKEISIMKMVKHDNVVSLYEVLASRTKIFIVLELITGGELFDKIVSEGRFNEEMARYYFRQLIKGVSYCHSQGVCHRDLKPENLLLDEKSSLKISDFGLSALYGGEASDDRMTLLHTTCGTPNYVAPEVLSDKGYDGRAADIWSCGVILYVLLAGFLPFDEPHMSALFRKIQKADFTYPSWFTAEVRGLLDQILVPDPAKRLTLDGVMSHSWFAAGEASPGAAPAEGTASAAAAAEGTLVPTPSKQQMEAAVSEGVDESAAAEAAAADDEPKVGGRNLAELLSTKGGPGSRKAFVTTKSIAEAVEAIAKLLAETGATVEKGEGTVTGAFFQNEGGEASEGAAPLPALGEVKFQVLVHEISEGVRMAEVSKVKGDSLAFHNFFLKVAPEMEKAVEDLVPEEVVAEARARGAGTA